MLVARAVNGADRSSDAMLEAIRPNVPNYMVPSEIVWRDSLPRNANGKLDRKSLAGEYARLFEAGEP